MVTRASLVALVVLCATAARSEPGSPPGAPPTVVSPVVPAPAPEPPAEPPLPIAPEARIAIFHVPVMTAKAGDEVTIDVRIFEEALLEKAWVEVRPAKEALRHAIFDGFTQGCRDARGDYLEATRTCRLELTRRKTSEIFGVVLPASFIQPPGITYRIVTRSRSGVEGAPFASEAHPQPVLVAGETAASRRADRLARHNGNEAQVLVRSEASFFGTGRVDGVEGAANEVRSDTNSDYFWTIEAIYTSRPLMLVYAFSLGLGVMRGERATYELDNRTIESGTGPQPGLNYGFGEVDFEILRNFYLTPRVTLGASEAGFAAGVGAKATIGRMTSTRLILGVDWISSLGVRGWLNFAWTTVPRFPMGLTLELTELPSSDTNTLGSRLLYDLGIDIGDATLSLRVGFALRASSYSGGLVGGLGFSYDF